MSNDKSSGLSFPAVLQIVFLALKMTGNIDWSWWLVTSPMWLLAALLVTLTMFMEPR